jgi:acyl carrier protein
VTRDEVASAIRAILATLAPEVDLAQVRPDADLREELDIDSMDFLRFLVGVKERLGVEVPESDTPRVRTLAGCVEYVAARVGGAGPRG